MDVTSIAHVDVSGQSHGGVMPGQTRWKHAIEYIDSSLDPLDQIKGRSYAHQVARFIFWKDSIHDIDHGERLSFFLPYG